MADFDTALGAPERVQFTFHAVASPLISSWTADRDYIITGVGAVNLSLSSCGIFIQNVVAYDTTYICATQQTGFVDGRNMAVQAGTSLGIVVWGADTYGFIICQPIVSAE